MTISTESKILVTGGAGFIGGHLCQELLNHGYRNIHSLDNYFTGSVTNHLEGVHYHKADTNDIHDTINFVPDLVFHLGEYSRVEKSFDDIETVWKSNVSGSYNVLQFCVKHNSKLIYAGSSTKFADGGIGSDQSPYAFSKAYNTKLIKNFGKWYNLNHAIVYFYNAYGAREMQVGDYATLIGIFTRQAELGEDLTVVSPGTQRRNFTHVSDIASALVKVGIFGHGDGYGIGHDRSWSVLEVAELFGRKIKMLPPRDGNRMNAELFVEKTKALGWKAEINLEDYICNLRNG